MRDKARKRRDQTLNEIDERFNAEVITKMISIIILMMTIRAERIVCVHSSVYIVSLNYTSYITVHAMNSLHLSQDTIERRGVKICENIALMYIAVMKKHDAISLIQKHGTPSEFYEAAFFLVL